MTIGKNRLTVFAERSKIMQKIKIHIYLAILFLTAGLDSFAVEFSQSALSVSRAWYSEISDYDVNGDGLYDIMYINFRMLVVHIQKKDAGFSSIPDYSLFIPYEFSHISFLDINNDSTEELILLSGKGVFYESLKTPVSKVAPKQILNIPLPLKPKNYRIYNIQIAVSLSRNVKNNAIVLPRQDGYAVYELVAPYEFKFRWDLPSEKREYNNYYFYNYKGSGEIFGNDMYYFDLYANKELKNLECDDYNKDGLLDFQIADRYFIQNRNGGIDDIPTSTTLVDDIYKDNTEAGDYDFRDEYVDLNGDSIIDRVLFKVELVSLKTKTTVLVHLGKKDKERKQFSKVSYNPKPDYIFKTKGFPVFYNSKPFVDINNDGKLDLVLFAIDIDVASASSQIKAFVERGLSGFIKFYFWQDGKGYSGEPSVVFDIPVSYEIYGFRNANTKSISYSSDIDGDKFKDLVLKISKYEAGIFRYEPATKNFSKKPISVLKTSLPINSISSSSDWNSDGKNDIVIVCYDSENPSIRIKNFFISR